MLVSWTSAGVSFLTFHVKETTSSMQTIVYEQLQDIIQQVSQIQPVFSPDLVSLFCITMSVLMSHKLLYKKKSMNWSLKPVLILQVS